MIWLLLIICIVVTLFFFENLMMMIANYIVYGVAAANNKNFNEHKDKIAKQNIISTACSIICGILWALFIYCYH